MSDYNLLSFIGQRIITSVWLTESKEIKMRRTCRERWLSWPWRPWRPWKWVMVQVPGRDVIRHNGLLYMHPKTYEDLKHMCEEALIMEKIVK